MRHSRLLAAVLAAMLMSTVSVASAVAQDGSSGERPAGKLKVNLAITKFKVRGSGTTAQGFATATLTDNAGRTARIRQPIAFGVQNRGSCRILGLVLDELDLRLLGLRVHLGRVNLQVTGRRRGGVLGNLFCRLANSRVRAKRASAARALNAHAARKPIRPLAFAVPLRAVAAQNQAGTCQVLTLVLGPLNLNLLGLVVDLNKVNLAITAVRGQGALGDLFCQLADNNQSGGQPSG
jgi:hypothetical protein